MAASCSPMVMTLWTQKNCLVNANDGDHGRPFSTTTTTTTAKVGVLSGALFFSFSLVATLLCEWMISQTTVTTGGGGAFGLHDSRTSPYGLAITTLITPVFDFPLNSSRLKCVVDNSRAGDIEPSPLDEIITVGKYIAAILQIFCNELFYVNELTLLSVIYPFCIRLFDCAGRKYRSPAKMNVSS